MDPREAASRVRRFIEARETHQSRRSMFGPSTNPFPDRIIAEYGYLDMEDLKTIIAFMEKQS